MSWLTLNSPQCVSQKVMCGRGLCHHRAQLHGELVFGHISGGGGAALEGWTVVSASIITYTSDVL